MRSRCSHGYHEVKYIMFMKSPTNINNIDTFADLRRYVSKRTSLSSAQSFERLVLDSIYDINKGQFTFQTTHSYYTEPRLKTLAKEVGIIWMKMQEEEIDYNNE